MGCDASRPVDPYVFEVDPEKKPPTAEAASGGARNRSARDGTSLEEARPAPPTSKGLHRANTAKALSKATGRVERQSTQRKLSEPSMAPSNSKLVKTPRSSRKAENLAKVRRAKTAILTAAEFGGGTLEGSKAEQASKPPTIPVQSKKTETLAKIRRAKTTILIAGELQSRLSESPVQQGGTQEGDGGRSVPTSSVSSSKAESAEKIRRAKTAILSAAEFRTRAVEVPKKREIRRDPAKLEWLAKEVYVSTDSLSDFELKARVGRGLTGSVLLARHKLDETFCAIKCVKKSFVAKHDSYRHLFGEKTVLEDLRGHPFIYTLFTTFQDEHFLFFVLEYLPGGELFTRLNDKERFSEDVAKFYSAEILSALEHIHARGWVYRDLKPENVMIDATGHLKLADFGFARKPDANGVCFTNCGTPAYLSPEQLNHKKTNGYKAIVDWWSYGCVLYECMKGHTPFENSDKQKQDSSYAIYLRVLKGRVSYPKYFSQAAKNLIRSLLQVKLEKRLTGAKDVKTHVFFKGTDWQALVERRYKVPFKPILNKEGDTSRFTTFDASLERNVKEKVRIDQVKFAGF